MENEVQRLILAKLLRSEGLRYGEAYPGEEIDDDLYNYHLQSMVKKGWVIKNEGKYRLSETGKVLVHQLDSKGKVYDYFKVSVLCYVFEGDKLLLHRRTREPYRGEVSSISGKIMKGEKIIEAAKRKLEEETGLRARFELKGVLRKIRWDREGNLLEDSIYHVCRGENPQGELVESNEFGENFWASMGKAREYQKGNISQGKAHQEMLEKIIGNEGSLFYFEDEMVM
jgi:8-oxo-dGTP pyrophosphatase MutT (NUDIX family)